MKIWDPELANFYQEMYASPLCNKYCSSSIVPKTGIA